MRSSRPREVSAKWDEPLFVFIDASFHPEDNSWPCGLGGVLVGPTGSQLFAFSVCLQMDSLAILGFPEKSTVIFEAELLAVILGVTLWKKYLKSRPCVFYVDNNATRDVSIAGRARTSPGSLLVAKLLALEDAAGVNSWFARVPSSSNIADPPSRGSMEGITGKLVSAELFNVSLKKILSGISNTAKVGEDLGPKR